MKLRTLSLLAALLMTAAACGGSDPVSSAVAGGAADQSDDLADTQEQYEDQLEELLESASTGSGTGTINVLGVDYIFSPEFCFADATSFDATGFGETADGVPFRASVSSSIETREGMEEAGLPQANIDAFFGDKDSFETLSVEVELGKPDNFTSAPDGMGDLLLDLFLSGDSDGTSYQIEGNTLSGSGQITDWNGVLIAPGETAAVNFTASCN